HPKRFNETPSVTFHPLVNGGEHVVEQADLRCDLEIAPFGDEFKTWIELDIAGSKGFRHGNADSFDKITVPLTEFGKFGGQLHSAVGREVKSHAYGLGTKQLVVRLECHGE